jgi:hypothetical protein
LINRYGGPVVHQGGTKITVSHVTDVVHTGNGAYRADVAVPASDFTYFQLALSGFGPAEAYVMSRDILRFASLCFWLKNDTGVSFTLKVELKDYRNSSSDLSSDLQFRRYPIPASSTWTQFCVPLTDAAGWTVVGTPDLRQARFIGFVFETTPALPLNGAVYFDDVVLIEPGIPMDPATAPLSSLVLQVARRQFDGLWGSRNRTHGMIPLNSVYADVAALNSTSAVVKLLPVAYQQGWVTQAEADAYITTLVTTLHTLMDHARYLPPRYVDWVTLEPTYVFEESPFDAAFLALALYQYRALPSTPPGLRDQISGLLGRFNFAAFGSPQGWKLAYSYGPPEGFTAGSYDGYSGEIWTMSLAAHLMPTNRVDITQYYHTGINRVQAFCEEPSLAHAVHSDTRFRAPFLQWLFPLFVKLDMCRVDNYPVPALATNPVQNAMRYQRDAHAWFSHRGRALLLQPDAGDDGSGMRYEQYSCYNDFGESDLFMPWSVAFSLLAELTYAEPALRSHLAHGLQGPLGLSDSVHWVTGAPEPAQITARHDFWNLSLSTMAMISFLFQDNEFLTSLPEVRAALEKVFTPAPLLTLSLNQTTFHPRDTLRVGLQAENPGPGFNADFYFGVLLPDGVTALFFASLSPLKGMAISVESDPRTFKPLATNVLIAQGFNVTLNDVLVFTFSGSEPMGTYVFFALLTPPNAFADGRVDACDILVIETKSFSFGFQ